MEVSIKMSSKEKAALRRQIKQFSRDMRQSVDKTLDAIAVDIIAVARENLDKTGANGRKITNTGTLKGSIAKRKTVLGGRRVGTNTGYGMYVEFGRPPGSFPNVDDLRKWARRKLGLSTEQADAAAYFIGKHIKEKGTKPQPFLMPAFNTVKSNMAKKFKNTLK